MRVGFYIGEVSLLNGGIAPYSHRVLRALDDHDFRSEIELCVIGKRTALADELQLPFISIPDGNFGYEGRELMQKFLNELQLDILHVPFQVPPAFNLKPLSVVTMHDVQEIHFPEFFTAEDRRERAIWHLRSMREAAAIVVNFDHVKQDLIRYFGCADSKVVVVPLPIDRCTLRTPTEAESLNYQRRYKSLDEFFLYPAQTWEHKNHLRLLEAFARTCEQSQRPLSLVCTGRKNEYFPRIEAKLADLHMVNRIIFTDIVSETELHWLYQECLGVVIPTLYEGGCFPLIEAMDLGAPVVCSAITSLPDTIKDTQFLFDPWSVESIANAMTRIATEPAYRTASRENGLRRIKELRSEQAGPHYERLWNAVAQQKQVS